MNESVDPNEALSNLRDLFKGSPPADAVELLNAWDRAAVLFNGLDQSLSRGGRHAAGRMAGRLINLALT